MTSLTRGPGWLAWVLIAGLAGCTGTVDLAFPPPISPAVESASEETLSSVLRRHRALQRLPASRLTEAIERTKARFLENPNLTSYQQLVSFLALPNVPLAEKAAILELLQQNGQAFLSKSVHNLHLVPEKALFEAIQQQQRAEKLTAAIVERDRKIAQLERTLNGLVATRDRCYTREASLERQLQDIQNWALKLRRQLDELGRIEESIEDRRKSTPLELPKQND